MNLAAVSFGAISTMVAYHIGINGHGLAARSTIWGIIVGVIIAALVGAIVSLPALRLRGLYLGLATIAFGVFLTDMILMDSNEHRLPLIHTKFSFFLAGQGINSLVMPPLKVGPLDLHNGTTFLVTVTVVFSLIGIGLVGIRNSSYGRRLTAMKDSPAASATLGQSLLKLKLSVFMLSAAIAGLGGILMSEALGSVTPDNFIIFLSLSLLMLTVVAGIGYVSGALMGGLLAGVGFSLVVATFHNLSSHHGSVHGLFSFLANFASVSPALIGIGVGRSPSGSVHDFIESYRTLRDRKLFLAGGAAVEVLIYVLALTGVIGNWTFSIITAILIMVFPVIGQITGPEAARQRAEEIPLELVGIDSPYTDAVRADLDRALGIEELTPVRRRPLAAVAAGNGAAPGAPAGSGRNGSRSGTSAGGSDAGA
jgi:ABC-type branched-subunit amino acid transport system permease subunit